MLQYWQIFLNLKFHFNFNEKISFQMWLLLIRSNHTFNHNLQLLSIFLHPKIMLE